jgi:serine/threonine-protein kinase
MVKDAFGITGKTLADAFYIEEPIAEGGFGVVYRAEHVKFRARVALKCLKIPAAMEEDQHGAFIERFREEAEILFHLSAAIPEVVRPLHVDTFRQADGTEVPYMAMEWVDGDPLDAIIVAREHAGQSMPTLIEMIAMLDPIARALARAHRFQVPGGAVVCVTHCDLKPENIIITPESSAVRAKILDYGIAKARELALQSAGRISESDDTNPFTPSYGAPEQWVPKRYGQSGPWTDVWGLALTMVESLSGQPPIDGDMHSMMGTALDAQRRPTPRAEGVEVSDEVESVFVKALAVDPRHRYKGVAEFWTALQHAAGVASSFEADPVPTLELDVPAVVRSSRPGATTAPSSPPAPSSYPPKRKPALKHDFTAPRAAPSFDLEVDPLRDRAPSMRVAKPPQPGDVAQAAPRGSQKTGPRKARTLSDQFRRPLQLFAIGVVLTLIDTLSDYFLGSTIMLGPVRLQWLAGGCAGVAVLAAFLSFMVDDSEDSSA